MAAISTIPGRGLEEVAKGVLVSVWLYQIVMTGHHCSGNNVTSELPRNNMPQKIYTSHLPPVPLVAQSIFTLLFSSNETTLVGPFLASQPAFVDADTGTTITRGQLRDLALQFAFGVRSVLNAERGDVVLVYSQNSVAWPVVVFGAGMCTWHVLGFS